MSSSSYVYAFLLCTVTLYAINPPSSSNQAFVNAADTATVEPVQTRLSLGADKQDPPKQARTILFKNSPFKKTLQRRMKALKYKTPTVYKVKPVSYRSRNKKRYQESPHYQYDDLVIGIKTELFRLGCYRGKVNTVWGKDVRKELASLNRGLSTYRAEQSTLNYLKKQGTLGCAGNRVWDQLVFAGGKSSLQEVASVEESETEVYDDLDQSLAQKPIKKRISKQQADKRIAEAFVKAKRKRRAKKRQRRKRRAARKTFGFNGMFGIDG